MIEYSVRKHFPELPDTTGPRDYARNYLEKLIQIPFRIPALGETETRIYITLLLIGAELPADNDGYMRLIAAARELLRRPWASARLDAQTVKSALGDKAGGVQNALTLSDQIGPILASGTQGNPRQIKRFLNSLLLRHATAVARGFGEEVKLPVLAKLMLAERFMPRLFDQIANAAARDPKGYCNDLALLEAELAQAEDAPKRKKLGQKSLAESGKAEAVEDGAVLAEWRAAEVVRTWARLTPSLGEVDLRPYLFVAKDRKDYFGAASALGRLAAVAEKLLGSKMAVQAFESELKQLVPAEAGQVFEELRGRVMGSDAFDTAPAGIDGIAVLVRAHPSLQSNLLDMLEALPADRCGPWPAAGWEGVIKEGESMARFERLLQGWTTSKNAMLKVTASTVLRTRKGR
jgi:predicted KAP-like P-loop ATPase